METMKVKTTGMHCQSCKMLIEMSLDEIEGVEGASVDLADETTEVTYDPSKVGEDAIVKGIESVGYGVESD
jgi:Cu+-exporting ATPase